MNGDIENREDGDGNDMTMNPIYRRGASYDKMEFPRHDIEALRTLGNGSYGRAFLARASGIRDGEKETMVVVKALKSMDDIIREEFNKEMEMLTTLQQSNVVTLLGVCKEDEPFYMIFESTEKVRRTRAYLCVCVCVCVCVRASERERGRRKRGREGGKGGGREERASE